MARPRKYPFPKVGNRFGRWVVLEIPEGADVHTKIPCRCTCGDTGTPEANDLVRGRSRGCNRCRIQRGLKIMHAAILKYDFVPKSHRDRLRSRVGGAIQRCYNPKNPAYKNYGGRGISVFPVWREDRVLFAKYLTTLDGWDDPSLTIDRIDNDGNYEPGNLRFVTRAKNNGNKSRRKPDNDPNNCQ